MSKLVTDAQPCQSLSGMRALSLLRGFTKQQLHSTSLPGGMQIAKLLIIPFVCLVEKFWLGKEFTRGVVTSVLVVVSGVAVV